MEPAPGVLIVWNKDWYCQVRVLCLCGLYYIRNPENVGAKLGTVTLSLLCKYKNVSEK